MTVVTCSSSGSNIEEKECKKRKLSVKQQSLPNSIKNIIILHLPLEEIVKIKNSDFVELWTLFHSPNHKHFIFRFTRSMKQMFSLDNLLTMGLRKKYCTELCTFLYLLQANTEENFHEIMISSNSAEASSVDNDDENGINRTVDGNIYTYWLSDGSENQNKVDWLLYDLGTVAVISQVSVAVHGGLFHAAAYWIEFGFERDEFHYRTREFPCYNSDKYQDFNTREHFNNILPTARYIRLWMRGGHQRRPGDNLWYHELNSFHVDARPLKYFPEPIKFFKVT